MSNDRGESDHILMVLRGHSAQGTGHATGIEMTVFWSWYETIKQWGVDHAHKMAVESSRLLLGRYNLSDEEHAIVRHWIEEIEYNGNLDQNRENQALTISYQMLQEGKWTRPRAARFAGYLLGHTIEADAWRKRLDKWIRENGKAPLQLPRSRRLDTEHNAKVSE